MSAETLQPKAIYEAVTKLEAFYTGGAVRVTRDQKHIACACSDEVKVLDVATGIVTRTLPGDSEPVTSLAVSPDCHTLVSASRSLQVKHWDCTSGECKRTWKPHRAPVADLAIDSSGGYVASGSADRTIKVTDLAGGYVTHHFTGHGGIVLRVLFHPKQLLLFSSCDDGEVRIWDLVTKSCAYSLKGGHLSAVPALSLSPDGWHLLSGGRDKVVCVWDIRSGSRVGTVPVFEAMEGLAVLPAGSAFPGAAAAAQAGSGSGKQGSSAHKPLCFATAGERGQIRIWRSDTGACVYTHQGGSSSSSLLPGHGSKSKHAAAATDGTAAAAGSEFVELLLLPGGKGLLAATGDARLLFYYPTVETEGGSAGLHLTRQLIGNHDQITDLAFIYTAGGSSSSSSKILDSTHHSDHQQTSDPSSSAAAAGGGAAAAGGSSGVLVLQPGEPRRLAVATNSREIRLFDVVDASCVGSCVGHRDIVMCLDTVRPAPGVELLASSSKDCEVRIWDPTTASCLAAAAGHVAAVTVVAWSRSKAKGGKYLASGGADKLLKLWDTSKVLAAAVAAAAGTGTAPALQQLSTLAAVAAHDKDINALAFSPNDALLATASQDKTVKLWKLPDLVLVQTLRGHKRGVWDVAFSPVDQVVLTCSGDKLLKMWSVSEGTCLRTFEGHAAGVIRAAWITAGTQVLSAGADGLLKLWDARSGADTATFEGHDDRVWGMTTSDGPAEALVATGGGDSRVVIWRDVTAVKAAEAEAVEEGLLVRQQELSNALADGDYSTAARLAFQLRHPGRLLDALRRQPGGAAAALAALQGLVGQLDQGELATALNYCREWNTNSRNAHLAQVLLQAVLKTHTPQQILQVPGARELIDGLLAYSERHAARIDRLMRATFILDYTLAASQVLLPEETVRDQQQQQQLQQQQSEGGSPQQQQQASKPCGDDLEDDFGELGDTLKMNGHSGDLSFSSDSDMKDHSSGQDVIEDQQHLQQQQQSDSEDEDMQPGSTTAAAGAAATAATRKRSRAAAVGGDPDDAHVDDAFRLPGWGGGDDRDDDWTAGSDDDSDSDDNDTDGDSDHSNSERDDDTNSDDEDAIGSAGQEGLISAPYDSKHVGRSKGFNGTAAAAAVGAGSSDDEMQDGSSSSSEEDESQSRSSSEDAEAAAAVASNPSKAGVIGGKQRSRSKQQQQQPPQQQRQGVSKAVGSARKRRPAAQEPAVTWKSPRDRQQQRRKA